METKKKRQKKKLKFYYFKNWRVIVAREEARNSGTRFYPMTLNWYAFPEDSPTIEFRDATHAGSGGIERAEIKLQSLYTHPA